MAEEESLNLHYQTTMNSDNESNNSMVHGNRRRTRRNDGNPRTSNEDIDGEDRPWSVLAEEVVELIMNRLRYTDHYNMNNICKSWHGYCISYRHRRQQVPACLISPPPKQQLLPWLLNIVADDEGSWSSCKMFDPKFKTTYTINMNPLKDRIRYLDNWKVFESKSGYLLLVSSDKETPEKWSHVPEGSSAYALEHYLIMYSPFLTGNNLLELHVLSMKGVILLATFDVNPSSTGNLGNFSFVVLGFVSGNAIIISTCRLGDDTWITQNIQCHVVIWHVLNRMYSERKFYYVTYASSVGAFDLDMQECSVLPELKRTPYGTIGVHLIKSVDGRRLYWFCPERNWRRHFRLDLSQQSTASSWELVGNMNDNQVVAFVGNGYKSVIELGEGSGCGLFGGVLSDIANRMYMSDDGDLIKYATFSNQKRTYRCTKLYGSLATQQCVRNMWIEPPY